MGQPDLFRMPRKPWNAGRITGAKAPLKPKHIWAIRQHLKSLGLARHLAMFNTALDAKLRGCDRMTDLRQTRRERTPPRSVRGRKRTNRSLTFVSYGDVRGRVRREVIDAVAGQEFILGGDILTRGALRFVRASGGTRPPACRTQPPLSPLVFHVCRPSSRKALKTQFSSERCNICGKLERSACEPQAEQARRSAMGGKRPPEVANTATSAVVLGPIVSGRGGLPTLEYRKRAAAGGPAAR